MTQIIIALRIRIVCCGDLRYSAILDCLPSFTAACYYRTENVETFDGRIYRLPEAEECEKVLAMDCSPEKSFAVLLRERGPEKVFQ